MDGRLFSLLNLCVTAVTNTPAYLSASLRTPISTASDFTLGSYLRPAETNHAAGAELWFVLGDSATRGNFLRAGGDFGAVQLRLVEGKTGLNATVPLAVLPHFPAETASAAPARIPSTRPSDRRFRRAGISPARAWNRRRHNAGARSAGPTAWRRFG
jgi:hypothetical protein